MSESVQHGNCADILPDYAGQVDLIVTSPPYDDTRKYAGQSEFNFHAVAPLIANALRGGGVLCWNVQDQQAQGDYSLNSFRQALAFQDLGLRCLEKLVYQRKTPRMIHNRAHLRTHEHVFVFTKPGCDYTFNPIRDRVNKHPCTRYAPNTGRVGDGLRTANQRRVTIHPKGIRSDVWEYNTGLYHTAPDMPSLHDLHPAMMPLKLAQDLISTYSDEGGLVLDPFAGAGTTLRAAKNLLRDAVGIEINADYCEVMRQRLAQEVLA